MAIKKTEEGGGKGNKSYREQSRGIPPIPGFTLLNGTANLKGRGGGGGVSRRFPVSEPSHRYKPSRWSLPPPPSRSIRSPDFMGALSSKWNEIHANRGAADRSTGAFVSGRWCVQPISRGWNLVLPPFSSRERLQRLKRGPRPHLFTVSLG